MSSNNNYTYETQQITFINSSQQHLFASFLSNDNVQIFSSIKTEHLLK